MKCSSKKIQRTNLQASSPNHSIAIQDPEPRFTKTANQIVADYKDADEERKLYLWLTYPDLREEFLDISMSQRKDAKRQQVVKVKSSVIVDLWRKLLCRVGYAILGF